MRGVNGEAFEELAGVSAGFDCKTRGAVDPPTDCDWPFCGCDPHADRVIAALEESGVVLVKPTEAAALVRVLERECLGNHADGEIVRELLQRLDPRPSFAKRAG